MRSDHETEEVEFERMDKQAGSRTRLLTVDRMDLARMRKADRVKVRPRAPSKMKAARAR